MSTKKTAGRPKSAPGEKKVTVAFQVKERFVTAARIKIQPIVDQINQQP